MFGWGLAKDQYIVQVHQHKFANVVGENSIHHRLERCRGVCEAEA